MFNHKTPDSYTFLSGGGEMGQLMHAKDWSVTSIGDPSTWPQSLRTTLSIILHSKFPMFLFWGTEHICFYNDAYRPSLGQKGKHPESLGSRGEDVWPEIWNDIYPLIQQVMSGGEATWAEDELLPIYRNGALEDVYWTYSYSPVTDETGTIAGVFVTCTETTDKISTHNNLEENRNQLQFAIESAELGTWDYNPATNKFTANKRLKEWFGLPDDSEIALDYAIGVISDNDKQRTIDAIEKALDYNSGGHYAIEYTINNPITKQDIVVFVKGKAWFNEHKEAYRFYGIMQDVTQQVGARKKLEENEYRFRTLIEQSPVAMSLYTGADLKIQYANDAMLGFFGKTNKIIGLPLSQGVPELKGQPFLGILKNVFDTAEPYIGKEQPAVLEVDGRLQTFYFDFTYKALLNKDGSTFGIHHTAIDVTQQVLANNALQQSETRFRHTVDQAPLGITILRGPEYFVEMANPGYLKIVNKTEVEFVGKPLFESLPQVKEAINDILDNVIKTGIPYHGVEFPVYIKHGQEDVLTYFNFVYQPLLENDGSITGIIVVASDVTTSVKAKHQLAESESQFRNMVLQSPIPMTIIRGKDYIIETANIVMFRDVWRKKEEDVIGKPILKAFPELMDQKYPELLNQVYTTGIPYTETESVAFVEGDDGMQKFYLDFEYAPLLDPDQTISGIIITVNNVTEKVEARLKAEESEQKLNLVIDASELGTWEWNMQTDEMKYSDRFVQMFGFGNGDEIVHDQFVKRLHPDDMAARNISFEKAYKTGTLNYESRIIWSNGIQRWMEVKGKVFMDEKGAPLSLIGTTRDTTDEKYHQQELEDRERKFRLLANAMPQLVWTASAYGDINYYNQSVYSFSGLSELQLLKYGWMQLVHPDDMEQSLESWNYAVESGKDFIIEHRFKTAEGEYRWQLTRAIPQKDPLGNIRMWVGTSTDIQEIKELDQQKDLFIGMASHELKTPITTVKGYVQLLQDIYQESNDSFLQNSLEKMHRQIETLTDLISDLLDLSKIKAGNLHYNKENFAVSNLVEEVVNNIRHINPNHTIEFNKETNAIISGDRNRVGQVLINFLTNAIKYSPESKKLVKVATREEAGQVIVSVEDKGVGINKADQEKIFQRFYRVEGKNEKTFPGFGIGLFISAEIIKKHSGKIGVSSEQGNGATFYFSIPIVKS